MLISVHMPKTAGLSFRGALESHFGAQLRPDYGDYPLAHSGQERRAQALTWGKGARIGDFAGITCVHGHFLPLKYLTLAEKLPCTFVTWLREPVSRLISHYDYWQRSYDPAADHTSSLHRRVVEERWSLRQFCLSEELKDVYTEFLWGFSVERLDFIGITEFYADELRYFSRHILGNKLPLHTLNLREDGKSSAPEERLESSDRAEIEDFHARDVALYQQALQWRLDRQAGEQSV